MFKITLDIKNTFVLRNIASKKNLVRTGIRQAFYKIGKQYVEFLRVEIKDTTKKTGRLYRLTDVRKSSKNPKRPSFVTRIHQASAPAEFPAKLSGDLGRSLDFVVVGAQKMIFGAKAKYAGWLQDGTNKMAPRALIKETIQANQQFSNRTLNSEIQKVLSNK